MAPKSDATEPLKLVLGTRRSKLARIQTDMVAAALRKHDPNLQIEVRATDPKGDQDKNTALYDMADKNLWTGDLEALLEAKEVDAVVHCLKGWPEGWKWRRRLMSYRHANNRRRAIRHRRHPPARQPA
jgi:hydroxymethylbilane synthase